MKILHCVEFHHSTEPRVLLVRKLWEQHYAAGRMVRAELDNYSFSSHQLGDSRKLPTVREVLDRGRKLSTEPDDILLLTNGDTILHPLVFELLKERLDGQPAVSSFRLNIDDPRAVALKPEQLAVKYKPDYGRDLFAFRRSWLDANWSKIPLMFVGEWEWDLCMVLLIRTALGIGIKTTKDLHNITQAELPLGYVLHEKHDPMWRKDETKEAAGKLWNKAQARGWYEDRGLKHLYTLG